MERTRKGKRKREKKEKVKGCRRRGEGEMGERTVEGPERED